MECPEITIPKDRYRTASRCVLAAWMMALSAGASAADATHLLTRMDVFTTTDLDRDYQRLIDPDRRDPDIDLQVYRLDGIQHLEQTLSESLPNNAAAAKRIVLQRIQQLDKQSTAQLQQAAVGLAKLVQYGIDRVPVIVFNGEAVVYGITDPGEALQQYRRWRAGGGS